MLELKNISYKINVQENNILVQKEILKNINLTIVKGETLVITGPNGSGKSTLAKIIMGIIKPTSGKIYWRGKDITNLGVTERAKLGISFAFQQPVKFKGLTVKDLLELSCHNSVNISEACEHLSDVGLCARDYLNREVNEKFSGGELKRIEIASVTLKGGELSIFDEPEAGIDLWSFNSLIGSFQKIKQKSKGAILIISHQERLISVADRVLVLSSGKIEKIGKAQEVLSSITPQKLTCTVLEDKHAK